MLHPIPELDALTFCRAAFIARLPGIDVRTDRETALARLRPIHTQILRTSGFSADALATAEQIHGRHVAVLTAPPTAPLPAADGLATDRPGLCLGIYVADCAAVWFADPVRRVVALCHSGKKGTELNIVASTLETLTTRFQSQPADLTVVVSPCIRPPDYEVDFATRIADQARALGVTRFSDPGTNTAADPAAHYSYRREKGQTGRMLAVIEILPGNP